MLKNRIHYLKNPVIYFLIQLVPSFLLLFTLNRFLLLIFNREQFIDIPSRVIAKAFLVGLRFDLSVTLYLLTPFFLMNYLFYFGKQIRRLLTFNAIYLTLIAFFILMSGIVEVNFYSYFHIRLNAFAVHWKSDPAFVLKMLWETYPVFWYLLLLFGAGFMAFHLFLRWNRRVYQTVPNHPIPLKAAQFVLISLFIFIGIRGTLSYKTPLKWGHAYFSNYNAANQLALNGLFTLANDLLYASTNPDDLARIFHIQNPQAAFQLTEKMIADSSGEFIRFPLREYHHHSLPRRWNVVIFLLESFSSYDLEKFEEQGVPLFFNQLKMKGIYFPNFYSNGFHTYMGIFSSLFGMPNVYGMSILKRNEGQQEFSGLINILKEKGYVAYFGVSHDPNFDNMAGFLRGNGVDKIVSQFDFPSSEVLGSMGVADHRLFEKMNELFRQSPQPFVGVILSTNNHGPWIIPKVEGKSFHSTFDYTDWAVQHFLSLAEREAYFQNTIFVITADHGHAEHTLFEFDPISTHIPCLIYNPLLIQPEIRQNICGHIDLTQILLSLLQEDYQTTNFGRDVLNLPNEPTGFAVMQEGNLFAMRWDDWYLIDRPGVRTTLHRLDSPDPREDLSAQFPELFRELQQKLRAYLFSANEIILNRKVSPKNWQ